MTPHVRTAIPEIVWPGVPAAMAASLLALQWQLRRSQWWPRERLIARQFLQLRGLLAHALAEVPWYRAKQSAGTLSAVATLDERSFRRWPVLKKSDLRTRLAELHAERYPPSHGAWQEVATSGSTGHPIRTRHTLAAATFGQAMVVREHLAHRRDLSGKFAGMRLAATAGSTPGWGLMSIAFETGVSTTIDVMAGLDRQLAWLLAERPAYLLGYPSNLRALILKSRAENKRPDCLLQLLSFGEMLPPDLRELARTEWGVDVADNYSCREAGSLAFQCPDGDQYHVHAEAVYLEVLRDDGEPCDPGETGRVVITPLHNFAMPLVRYELGDYAQVGGPCRCGRGLPTLSRIVGRVTNMAVDPTGRRFWPGLRASFLTDIAPFEQIRLVQHSSSDIELRYVMASELNEEQQRRCGAAVESMLGYPFRVRCTRVPALERGPGGKYEDFVSLLNDA